jgi:hypothetical protein
MSNEIGQHDHLTRQLDLIPVAKLGETIHIIGSGAIGSFTALALAKMGVTDLHCWDMDTVSIENMSNQFFRFKDIGKNKAAALMELVEDFTRVHIKAYPVPFEVPYAAALKGIVIVAVDSMAARRMIYEAIKDKGHQVKLLIDPRMSAEFYSQTTINPFSEKDQQTYEKLLFSDDEAVRDRCTAKSTVYTATLAAGLIVKSIKNFMLGEDHPRTLNWDIKSSLNGSLQVHPGNVAGQSKEETTTGSNVETTTSGYSMQVIGTRYA